MIAGYKLRVTHFPFRGRVSEALAGRTIGIRQGLPRRHQRWLTLHAIGHHLMHKGNHLGIRDWAMIARYEREAELFTGYVYLWGTWGTMETWELAEHHQIPERYIRRWERLLTDDEAISAEWFRRPRRGER